MFDGGSLGPGFSSYPLHMPRCLPFDVGVFSLYKWEGALRPVGMGTKSMLEDGASDWREHRFTRMLDELTPVLVGG